jgi:hypothetical protein
MSGPWIWFDKGALTTILMKTACSYKHINIQKSGEARLPGTYKDLILCALYRVLRFEERESNEQSGNDIQSEFGHHVRGVSPMPDDLTSP